MEIRTNFYTVAYGASVATFVGTVKSGAGPVERAWVLGVLSLFLCIAGIAVASGIGYDCTKLRALAPWRLSDKAFTAAADTDYLPEKENLQMFVGVGAVVAAIGIIVAICTGVSSGGHPG